MAYGALPPGATIRGGYVYAADGSPLGTVGEVTGGPSYASFRTPEDVKRERSATRTEAAVNAGVGAIGTAGQLLATTIDTPQDTRNKTELARLQNLERTGKMGLSSNERQYMESTQLNPLRAMSTEDRQRREALLASKGGASVADLTRAERESRQDVQNAEVAAGNNISRANIEAAARQRQELEQRTAYESNKQKEQIRLVNDAVMSLLEQGGKFVAAEATGTQLTDADLLAMQSAKYADGSPVYPAYQGKTLDEMRAGTAMMKKIDRKAATGDVNAGALQAGQVYQPTT